MWIKICANTNLEDALLAAELGADAVGFVFAPSTRQVTPAQAADIVAHLPGSLETVGVFPAWPADRIVEAVEQARLTTIQLHGVFDRETTRAIYCHFANRIKIMQVVHWDMDAHDDQTGQVAEQVTDRIKELATVSEVDRILVDSKAGKANGGTGRTLPWGQAQPIFTEHPNVVLAGGLNPDNVGEAIHCLEPWGVDVASGVEASLGKKDSAKLEAFICAARHASLA